ncbi:MAG: hypothetical protein ACREFP_19520 [Acetobacteraceae bacterium]
MTITIRQTHRLLRAQSGAPIWIAIHEMRNTTASGGTLGVNHADEA